MLWIWEHWNEHAQRGDRSRRSRMRSNAVVANRNAEHDWTAHVGGGQKVVGEPEFQRGVGMSHISQSLPLPVVLSWPVWYFFLWGSFWVRARVQLWNEPPSSREKSTQGALWLISRLCAEIHHNRFEAPIDSSNFPNYLILCVKFFVKNNAVLMFACGTSTKILSDGPISWDSIPS